MRGRPLMKSGGCDSTELLRSLVMRNWIKALLKYPIIEKLEWIADYLTSLDALIIAETQ